jgi:hypothetical protein
VKRVDKSERLYEVHDMKCSGSFEGKGFKNIESGIRYPCGPHCNKKKGSSNLRKMVSGLEKFLSDIAEDVVNMYLLNGGTLNADTFNSVVSIRYLSRQDAISLILEYFKGNYQKFSIENHVFLSYIIFDFTCLIILCFFFFFKFFDKKDHMILKGMNLDSTIPLMMMVI